MKNSVLILIVSLFSTSIVAQEDINSRAYRIMLKGMLSHSVNEVSVEEANSKQNILFVDSREPKEFEISHLRNAINVGYDSLDLSPLEKVDKSQEIIVYCSIGYRSEKVAEKLKAQGFTNVSNLYGGIFEWKNQGKIVYNPSNTPTDSVHAFSKTWGIWLSKGKKVY